MAQKDQVKVELIEFEKAVNEVRALVEKQPELKLRETEAKTGFSYFAGKKRLCKVLKTKRGVRLEINVQLPKSYTDKNPEIENISPALAHKKHLGTMKHIFKSSDSKMVNEVMVQAMKAFTKEVAADLKAEQDQPKVDLKKQA